MSTDSPPEDSALEGGSTGYVRAEGGGFRPNTATLPPRGSPAGGGYSTVQDLLRFANALLGHKLLNAEYTELVTSGKVATGNGAGKYAYGFGDTMEGGVRWFGHGGGGQR